jgi:hypothetical protein
MGAIMPTPMAQSNKSFCACAGGQPFFKKQ